MNAAVDPIETFRAETRAWLEDNCPPEMRRPMRSDADVVWGGAQAAAQRAPAPVAGRHGLARLDHAGLAQGLRRRRPLALGDQGAARGDGGAGLPLSAHLFRHLHARPGAAELRQRGAEAGAPAKDRARRDPLVPGLFRARRRLRPSGAADLGGGCGRPLRRQRPEGLDQLRRQGRLDLLPGAHRQDHQAGRHQLPAVRHG